MKILMLGWELPPLYAGGIGMVCYEMIKELSKQNYPVTYMMPMGPEEGIHSPYADVVIAENHFLGRKVSPKILRVPTLFHAYQSPEEYEQSYNEYLRSGKKKTRESRGDLYGKDLFIEVDLFAKRMYNMIDSFDFDVLHAHDWFTYPAATAIADKTGKPMVVHIHNTIFDRYLGDASQHERDIEYNGLKRADLIVAISDYVKNTVVTKYGIDPNKIRVVHNANTTIFQELKDSPPIKLEGKKVVVFTGRMTLQKGPEYLVHAAKKVVKKRKDVMFVMAGDGEQVPRVLRLIAEYGLGKYFIITGKQYNMSEGREFYKRADCYVMPSVSEPFGIVPLEAMSYGAPTIVTKQSGCSEVLTNALKVDFWDVDELANKILAIISYSPLSGHLSEQGQLEVESITWDKSVVKLVKVYQEAIDKKRREAGVW